jgi:uncharacterized surface protein with fasciclin (FAS1) repeats
MNNSMRIAVSLLLLTLLFTNCRKKAFDEYYGRPDNLAAPVYQQLEAKGNFKSFLACIEKAGYKATLSAAGYWTLFAPNDNAFQKFFTERSISDISRLDSGTCRQIVTYCLVYNAFAKTRIGDYQAAAGWVPNQAFKRRTANYTGFYDDTTQTGEKVKALSANRNGGFILGDNNNKYIPYFVNNFLSSSRITASDYNYFYPSTTYSGFNVVDASVVTADIVAENGVIHEIDKVLLPLPNIDQYLASNPAYSEFKKLFDKYMVTYILNGPATDRYKVLTGSSNSVYIKSFNGGLAYSPNNENYLKLQDNDGQANGWTMFAPRNEALRNYINSVILENYKSLDQLPLQIIIDLLNAHMFQTSVWPSKFGTTTNVQAETAKFDPVADIIDKKILSNGIFYGTTKVQQANVFSTVYGKPYLDPNYLLMTRLLDENLRFVITVPNIKYTVIMMPDNVLRAFGYEYNSTQSQWQYTVPNTTNVTVSAAIRARLQRILSTHIIPTPNGELDNLSGSGIVETLGGDYIKYSAGRLISSGSQDSGYTVTAGVSKSASNGRVNYGNSLLTNTSKTVANSIISLGTATTSAYYSFAQLVKNSTLYNAATGEFTGMTPGVFFTVFAPDNAAIIAAAKAGLLPVKNNGTPNIDNLSPAWSAIDRDKVNDFLRYHIINKTTVVPDGKKIGTFETIYKRLSGDAGTVSVNSTPNSMVITDNKGRTSSVVLASSNNLADRTVIHLINNFLQYDPN